MPTPYQTNCFDYTKIGCKSKSDCVDKCIIELTTKQCLNTNVNRSNNKNHYYYVLCSVYINGSNCEDEYNSPDCFNEYYTIKSFSDLDINYHFD